MRVSIIITTYNRPDALLLVLKSIELQTKLPAEVIIADDGSASDTEKSVANYQKNSKLRIIHSWQEDIGFRASKSRNRAIACSNGDYILLIDGDIILHPMFIEDHINHAEKGFFIQGTRVLLSRDATNKALKKMKVNFFFFSSGLKNRKNAIYSNFLSGFFTKKSNKIRGIKTCNMGFFKQDCLNVNGFNNDFVGWGREDSEFAARLINNGIKRKNLRFKSIQFHLWHEEVVRTSLSKNNQILKSTINNSSIWCNNGIDKYS